MKAQLQFWAQHSLSQPVSSAHLDAQLKGLSARVWKAHACRSCWHPSAAALTLAPASKGQSCLVPGIFSLVCS
eukprot:scaffold72641_cov19-Tisochrysis_lutea.AAC.1